MPTADPHAREDARPCIVFVADVALAPATHGNRVRSIQLVEALRTAGYRVLYVFWDRTGREGDIEAMRALVDELVVVSTRSNGLKSVLARRRHRMGLQAASVLGRIAPRSRSGVIARAWWWLVRQRSAEASCPIALRARVDEILASRPACAVLVTYANLAPLLDLARARHVLGIVDTQDVMHWRARRIREQGIKPTGLLLTRDAECALLAHADVVLAIQPREAEELRTMVGDKSVVVVEHGLRAPRDLPPAADLPLNVVVIGSNNRQNQHGLEWFLEQVWPRVLSQEKDAQLLVFGPLSRTKSCAGPNVVAKGEVHDVREAYEVARVVVNPVLAGSGLKIKTVEALVHERPVVTTSVGAEGLEEAAHTAFALSDDPIEFAREIVDLLRDREHAALLGAAAGLFARGRFSMESAYAPLIRLLRERTVLAVRVTDRS